MIEPLEFIRLCEGTENVKPPAEPKKLGRPPRLVFENGILKTIYLDGSLIKKMMFKGDKRFYCPKYIYEVQLMRRIEDKSSIYMLRGQYFESMALGSTAYDGPVLDLPRIRGGKKGIDQIRIDAQLHAFPQLVEDHGAVVIKEGPQRNTQIRNKVKWDGGSGFEDVEVFITMTFDWVTPFSFNNAEYPAAIVDLKLTGDLVGKFGEFCWARPEDMDHISMFIYGFSSGLPTFYWVFDYSTRLENKIIPVNTNIHHPDQKKANEAKLRLKEMDQSIRSCVIDIMTYNQIGWHTEPSFHNCKNCPIESCKDRQMQQEI